MSAYSGKCRQVLGAGQSALSQAVSHPVYSSRVDPVYDTIRISQRCHTQAFKETFKCCVLAKASFYLEKQDSRVNGLGLDSQLNKTQFQLVNRLVSLR